MRIVRKISISIAMGLIGIAVTALTLNNILKSSGGLSSLSVSLEAMKLKRLHPGMNGDEIQKKAHEAPTGIWGLLRGFTTPEPLTEVALPAIGSSSLPTDTSHTAQDQDIYISARANPNALIERQTDPTLSNIKNVRGVVENLPEGHKVSVSETSDGREAIAVIKTSNREDDLERIMSLNIPEDARRRILRNYQRTGILPEILVREKSSRTPSSETASSPEDKALDP